MRAAVQAARRVVVKVGSSSLTRPGHGGLDGERVDALVAVLADRLTTGCQLVLVSSGAIAAGLPPLGLTARPRDLATQQAAASVGQGLLLHRYTEAFARYGRTVGQVLLTADDLTRRTHYRNAHRTLARLLDVGALPVVNENDTVATEEIRFGDNDRLAALVAHLVQADLLVLLSDVDGLYDGDPRRPGASLVGDVRDESDLAAVDVRRRGTSGVGTGGMQTKVDAARIATSSGLPVVVTSTALAAAALAGDPVGTYFHPTGVRRGSRLLWLAHASTPRGRLHLDAGAVRAVVERRSSLLPAGVVAVDGDFEVGDPVDLLDESGHVVARGLVNFDASELPGLLGRSTRELAAELGPAYEREIVHRDDLVLLVERPAPGDARGGGRMARMWLVTLTVAGDPIPDGAIKDGLEQLAHERPFLLTGRYAPDRAEVRYWEEAPCLEDAAALALRLWGEHRGTAGLPHWEIVGLEVVEREVFQLRGTDGPVRLASAGDVRPF